MPRRFTPLLALLCCAAAPAPAAAAPPPVGDEIIVVHRGAPSAGERAELRAEAGVRLERRMAIGGELVEVADGSRAEALAELRADPQVRFAEPNRVVRSALTALAAGPGQDRYQPMQWALRNTGQIGGVPGADARLEEAWAYSRGAGVTVGIVDTGIDAAHPDLAGRLVPGATFLPGGAPDVDLEGHGTHVAGIVAAEANGIGTVGGAPEARLMSLQALGTDGYGTIADVAEAFEYAGKAGLRVVNASLTAPVSSRTLDWVIGKYFPTLFVVAAGNDAADVESGGEVYPCESPSPNVLCVGASTSSDARMAGSNWGARSVDLLAPGENILSTYPGGRWMLLDGTSMAAPMVSAAAALLASVNPDWPAARLKQALLAGVGRPAGVAGLTASGGRLSAAGAFAAQAGGDTEPPLPPAQLWATPAVERATLRWAASPSGDLALYRVYRREPDGSWALLSETGDTELVAAPLPPGAAVFAVAAVDSAGNPSALTTTEVMIPAPPAAGRAPAPQPAPRAPAAQTALATVGKVSALRKRGRLRGVRFVLSAGSPVELTLARRSAGRYRTVASTRLELAAGRRTVAVRRGRLAGMKLTRGRWKLAVVAPGNLQSLAFRWR